MASEIPTRGVAASAADAPLKPMDFSRHAVGEMDVLIDVKYCGVCHSDLHVGESLYVAIPGLLYCCGFEPGQLN